MYPNFIVAEAVDHLLHDRFPFDQIDDRTLADIGVDRQGHFIDPGDHRHAFQRRHRVRLTSLTETIKTALTAVWRRRPVL